MMPLTDTRHGVGVRRAPRSRYVAATRQVEKTITGWEAFSIDAPYADDLATGSPVSDDQTVDVQQVKTDIKRILLVVLIAATVPFVAVVATATGLISWFAASILTSGGAVLAASSLWFLAEVNRAVLRAVNERKPS